MKITKISTEFEDAGRYRVTYHKGSELIEIEEYIYIDKFLNGEWNWKQIYIGFPSRIENALELYNRSKGEFSNSTEIIESSRKSSNSKIEKKLSTEEKIIQVNNHLGKYEIFVDDKPTTIDELLSQIDSEDIDFILSHTGGNRYSMQGKNVRLVKKITIQNEPNY